jgi:hypothetical protein
MKTLFAIAIAAILLLSGLDANAQAPIVPTQPKVNLTLEQRHVIREIVKDLKIEPAPAGTATSIGEALPATIKLQAMPAEVSAKVPQIKSHQFFVTDSKVVLVEPKDRTVVEVIE